MRILIHIILAMIVVVTVISGQSSSIMPDSVVYITPEDEVHLRDKQASYLFKMGTDLALEYKLGKAFSLSAEVYPDFLRYFDSQRYGVGFGLNARYYYQMNKRVKTGKQASNLSGAYIELGRSFRYNFIEDDELLIHSNHYTTSMAVGFQQRYLENEYFDFKFQLSYVNQFSEQPDNILRLVSSLILSPRSAYGFVLGKRHNVDKESLCPVIKCYTNRKSGLKIIRDDFFRVGRHVLEVGVFWTFELNPRIGYEFKVANSPFTVSQELGLNLFFDNVGEGNPFQLNLTTYTYELGGRYYFNMNRKVLSGEQGNNLNGFYGTLIFQQTGRKFRTIFPGTLGFKNGGSLHVGFGRQTEITGRLYLDAQLKMGVNIYGENYISVAPELDFTVGYMF